MFMSMLYKLTYFKETNEQLQKGKTNGIFQEKLERHINLAYWVIWQGGLAARR